MSKESLRALRGIYETLISELYHMSISKLSDSRMTGEVLVVTYAQIFTVTAHNDKAAFIASQLKGMLIDNCDIYNNGGKQCTRFNTTKKLMDAFFNMLPIPAVDISLKALYVFKKLYTKNFPVEELMVELKLSREKVYELYNQGEKAASFLLGGLGTLLLIKQKHDHMPTILAELNVSADISFQKLESTYPEYYELVFDILQEKQRTKNFNRSDCFWKGFINQKFCFIIISVKKDSSTIMELYYQRDAVLLVFANYTDSETTIWEITCVHDEYLPFTDFILGQFIKYSTENKNTSIIAELKKGDLKFDAFFQKHKFIDSVSAGNDVIKSWRKKLC